MLINYLSSARIEETSVELESPDAVHPFTKETARILWDRSEEVPRWFNRMANYILLKAAELEAEKIELDILQQGLEYGRQELRGQELTAEDYYVLDLVLEKGVLSDANISLDDLERVKVQEFAQILPILDKLVQLDMVRRLPTERATEYGPNPMVLPE